MDGGTLEWKEIEEGVQEEGAAARTARYSGFVGGEVLHASDQCRRTERKEERPGQSKSSGQSDERKSRRGSERLTDLRPESRAQRRPGNQSEPIWVCSSSDPCFATRR